MAYFYSIKSKLYLNVSDGVGGYPIRRGPIFRRRLGEILDDEPRHTRPPFELDDVVVGVLGQGLVAHLGGEHETGAHLAEQEAEAL